MTQELINSFDKEAMASTMEDILQDHLRERNNADKGALEDRQEELRGLIIDDCLQAANKAVEYAVREVMTTLIDRLKVDVMDRVKSEIEERIESKFSDLKNDFSVEA